MFRDKFEKCSSSRLRDPPLYAPYDGPCGQDPGLYFKVIRARESLLYVAKAFEGSRHRVWVQGFRHVLAAARAGSIQKITRSVDRRSILSV